MAVITISRQFGAGGITLGKKIAKQLGYSFYDSEIIQRVAKQANVSTRWVESMEKEAGGKMQRIISGLVSRSFMDRFLEDKYGYIDEEIYVDLLQEIIRQIHAEGNAVILGRGGQYILKEAPDARHVLLVAAKEDRVRFMEEHYELTPAKALRAVNEEDRRRANLYKRFGKEDYEDPNLYDLVLNMSKMNIDRACHMVCRLITG
jgi:cytidylate kinase